MKLIICQQQMSQQESCNIYTGNVTKLNIMANKMLWREFGGWIKSNREINNLSQDGLGKLAELDRQQVYRIETGKSGTKRETVINLANALKLDENEALERAGFGSGEVKALESNLFKSVRSVLRGSENWNASQKDLFLEMLKVTVAGIDAQQFQMSERNYSIRVDSQHELKPIPQTEPPKKFNKKGMSRDEVRFEREFGQIDDKGMIGNEEGIKRKAG